MGQDMVVGMIGVGLMGHGIASNLVKHYPLVFLDHPGNQPTDDLVAAGAESAASIADICARADVIVLCVTGSPQVEAIVLGEGGLAASLRSGTVVLDCSTAIPSSTVKVAQAIEEAGGRYLDTPMTRTPKEAAAGRLNLLVGGDAALLETCRPLLACFAENITHVGGIGDGHRMKLVHNYVSLGFSTVLAEAAACAARAGIDAEALLQVLATGGGGGVVLERMAPYIRSGDQANFRFSLANACKDLGYYETMAGDTGSPHDTASAILGTLRAGLDKDAKATMPELVSLLEKGDTTAGTP